MKKKFIMINIIILVLTFLNIIYLSNLSKKYVEGYSNMMVSKITKYIVNNAYVREKINYYANEIYNVVKNDNNEINNIVYDSGAINDLINSIGERVYNMFNLIENSDLSKMNINASVLPKSINPKNGIVLEIPSGLLFNNYFFSKMGPKIPICISLTGEYESFISSEVKEYGINNAMVTVYLNIKVSEQLTLPFISKKITVENKFPIFMSLINGTIPNYYIGGFSKNSNLY